MSIADNDRIAQNPLTPRGAVSVRCGAFQATQKQPHQTAMTSIEQHRFITALERRGRTTEGDTVWAPSRGLWFSSSHFRDWGLNQLRTIFADRADRIEHAGFENCQASARENRDTSEAALEILSTNDSANAPVSR